MLPEDLIYDELKRQRDQYDEWQPEALELPLYLPDFDRPAHEEEEEESEPESRVIIIDMC